MQLQQLE